MIQKLYRYRFALLIGFTILMLLPAGTMPLMESTEARYAEIAREMIASGNYLEPSFNGIKHFHKPPLTYWLVTAGFKLFGLNNFGARFFGILAAVLAVVYLYRTACLFLEKDRAALTAALMFASSILFLVVSRLASTEIYLVCCVVAAQYYLARQIYGTRNARNALWYGLWLGLGFAIKGPIIFLFTLLPELVAKLVDRNHRHIFRWSEVVTAAAMFCVIALPWYLYVISQNPGLLNYFLKVQTVDRVVTDRFRRYEPPWYFFYIFAATFFPYTLFFLKGMVNWKKLPGTLKILLLYVALPLLVFTLAKGKHATYILPFYGSCAIVTAGMMSRDQMPRLRTLTVALLAIFALAPLIAGFVYPPLSASMIWLIPAGILLCGVWYLVWKWRQHEALWLWLAIFMVTISGVAIASIKVAGPQMRGYQQMAEALNARDPQHRLETLVFHGFLPSISFYRNQLAVMSFSDQRETLFQENPDYLHWYITSDQELDQFLAQNPQLFVIVRTQKIEEFTKNHPYRCDLVYSQRKHSAYLCKSDGQ